MRHVVGRLAAKDGEEVVVEACCALLAGALPEDVPQAAALSGHDASVAQLRAAGWRDYWWRTWGARGLLYVWSPTAAAEVARGVADEHWRPAEMCLKVAALREVAEAAEEAVRLARHDLARVRAVALRMLGRAGDSEHVEVVRSGLDDPAPEVRRAAALALERLADRLDLPGERLP